MCKCTGRYWRGVPELEMAWVLCGGEGKAGGRGGGRVEAMGVLLVLLCHAWQHHPHLCSPPSGGCFEVSMPRGKKVFGFSATCLMGMPLGGCGDEILIV